MSSLLDVLGPRSSGAVNTRAGCTASDVSATPANPPRDLQGHPSHVHHERRLHKLMLQDELRGYEAEQVRNSCTSSLTPERAGDSGSLRTSRDGGTSWWGGWGNVSSSMHGARGAARAADLMRTLGALGDPSNPWQVRPWPSPLSLTIVHFAQAPTGCTTFTGAGNHIPLCF